MPIGFPFGGGGDDGILSGWSTLSFNVPVQNWRTAAIFDDGTGYACFRADPWIHRIADFSSLRSEAFSIAPLTAITGLCGVRIFGDTVVIFTAARLITSLDRGATWTETTISSSVEDVQVNSDGRWIAITSSAPRVYLSGDAINWTGVAPTPPGSFWNSTTVAGNGDNWLVARRSDTLRVWSNDGGATWTQYADTVAASSVIYSPVLDTFVITPFDTRTFRAGFTAMSDLAILPNAYPAGYACTIYVPEADSHIFVPLNSGLYSVFRTRDFSEIFAMPVSGLANTSAGNINGPETMLNLNGRIVLPSQGASGASGYALCNGAYRNTAQGNRVL